MAKRSADHFDDSEDEDHANATPSLHNDVHAPSLVLVLHEWNSATYKMKKRRNKLLKHCEEFLEKIAPADAEECSSSIFDALRWILDHCAQFCSKVPKSERSNFSIPTPPNADVSDASKVMDMMPGALYYYLRYCVRNFPLRELILNFTPIEFETQYPHPSIRAFNLLNLVTLTAKVSRRALWSHLIVNNFNRDQRYYWVAFNLIDLGLFCPNPSCELFDEARCVCEDLMERTLNAVRSRPLSLKQLARLAIRSTMRDVHILKDCYKLPLSARLQDYVSFKCFNASIRPWLLEKVEGHTCYRAIFEVSDRYNITLPRCDCPSD